MQQFLQTDHHFMAGNVQETFSRLTIQKAYGRIYRLPTVVYTFLLSTAFFILPAKDLLAQPAIQWNKTIGGNDEDRPSSIQQTSDGGYIIAGDSKSNIGGDKSHNSRGDYDYWVVKLSANGTKQWDKTFGGTGSDFLSDVRQSKDGGYYLAGGSSSYASGDKSQGVVGLSDLWIIKLDPNGNLLWEKTVPMAESERVSAMELTPDGGMAIACNYSPAVEQFENFLNARFIKLSSTGVLEWSRNLSQDITLSSLALTSDGGYIIGANNSGFERNDNQYTAIKLSSDGTLQWTKKVGGDGYSSLSEIQQTPDGGYILSGISESQAGGDKTESSNYLYQGDYWVVKITSDGTKEWDKTIRANSYEEQSGLIQTTDGGYVVSGYTLASDTLDKSEPSQGTDLWLVKLSANGTIVWDKTIGGSSMEKARGSVLIATIYGGMAVACMSNSPVSGNKSEGSRGGNDIWVVKFAPENTSLVQTPIRINAGGPAFTTATKKLFIADQYYAGIDRTSSVASGDILYTSNDVLYRSGRSSPSFSYNIPVVNGKNNVTLHFAEVYFGAPGKKGGAGSRQFHVNMEGNRKLTNYDIFAAAGGAMRAVQLTIPVTVTDGTLNIDFLTGAADMPRVSAIEVSPAVSPVLEPIADSYVKGGFLEDVNYGYIYEFHVKGSASQPTRNASAYLKFQLQTAAPVTSAKLRIFGQNRENTKGVSLHAYGVNDDTWIEERINQLNAPAASTASLGYVSVNNVLKYYEIDVTSYVKAQQQSGDGLISLLLNDPANRNIKMSFYSKEEGSNPPQLVFQTTNSSVRIGEEEILTETQEKQPSTIYPNPAKDHIMLEVSSGHKSEVDLELTNIAGSQFQLQRSETEDNSSRLKVGLPGQLPAGIYLLKVQSSEFSEVLKVLITE